MRQIKFRAWDKQAGEMVGVESIRWQNENVHEVFYDTALEYDHQEGGRWTGECILMQFTGLLDKDGKEIYEGDVVLIGDIDKPYPVEWDETRLTWVIGDFDFLYVWEATVNIIGNVLENPNLLTH